MGTIYIDDITSKQSGVFYSDVAVPFNSVHSRRRLYGPLTVANENDYTTFSVLNWEYIGGTADDVDSSAWLLMLTSSGGTNANVGSLVFGTMFAMDVRAYDYTNVLWSSVYNPLKETTFMVVLPYKQFAVQVRVRYPYRTSASILGVRCTLTPLY